MGMELAIFAILVCVSKVATHPQCLDFQPPFSPAGSFQMCSEYQSFGCCSAEDDLEISMLYDTLSKAMTQETYGHCGEFLKTLLCQKCSPYAAHIYDAEDRQKPKTFPGLCQPYCLEMMKNCSSLVGMVTTETELISLSMNANTTKFCQSINPSDIDYCYPNLKTDWRFNFGLGTTQFYRQRSPFGSNKPNCVPLCVEEVANGLKNPLSLKHSNDGTHRMFVVEQVGIVWVYLPDRSRLSVPFMDLRKVVLVREFGYDERGMLDILFHPNHKENGLFYIYYTALISGRHHIKISEMKVSGTNMNRANIRTERTLLAIAEPAFNHNGGQLLFGTDGYLYIFTGDGGGAGDSFGPIGNAQNKKTMLGKVLRIDVNAMGPNGKPYAIPPDNPFVNNTGYLPEIYALGVRNIWRCGMDRGTETGYKRGRIFCGDVGQGKYEEIDIIVKGGNYGWRAYEGYSCYDRNLCNRKFVKNYIPPIHVYHHVHGKSVTGGYVYRGCQNPNLRGKYIFGDFSFGKLWMLRELPNGKWKSQKICMGSEKVCINGGLQNFYAQNILSFGEDESGEVYMLSTSNPIPGQLGGSIYRLVDPSRRGDPSQCQTNVTETLIARGTKAIPYKGNSFTRFL